MDNFKFTTSVSDIVSTFNARIAGDRTIDDYALFRDISSGINRPGGKPLFGRPLQWCAMMLDRWHKEFKTGRGDKELPVYDTLQRVSILMDSDLWAFETRNESRFKQTLFENHRHLLESIHNVKSMHNVKSIHNSQCIIHNVESIHNSQCIIHNVESIHNSQCIIHNVKSIHNVESINNVESMHNAECIMHNVKSIHNSQCIIHNESQDGVSDYALCIMNYALTKALQHFLIASTPYLTPDEFSAYDAQIRTAQYNHLATNRL